MNTAVISIKTTSETKLQAQKVAEELGVSLSALVKGFLRQLIKTKRAIGTEYDEIPNARTAAILKRAEEDYKKGNTSPAFDNAEDAIAWLHKQCA